MLTKLLQSLHSVIAAMFGVQSHRNYERDAESASIPMLVGVGIVLVFLLVVALYGLVNFLLN
jgi:hypothetical protein